MRDSIPDEAIKEQLRNLSAGSEKSYSKITAMCARYIYNYPRVVFGADSDRCGDFYEYVLVRLRDILDGYRESEARFVTWFTVVLRNRYYNFMRAEKARRRLENETSCVSLDAEREGAQSLYGVLGDGREYGTAAIEDFDRLVDGIVANLKDRQRVFFHLYYLETMRPEDCSYLAISLGLGTRRMLDEISAVRNSLADKYALKSRLHQKLNDLFAELLKRQRAGDEKGAEKVKKKREKVLEEYRRVKLNPSYEVIAGVLGVPVGTVSSGILRMKRAVRNYIGDGAYRRASR